MPAAGAKISRWRMPFVEIFKVQMLVVTEEKGLKALSRDAFPARLSRFKQNIALRAMRSKIVCFKLKKTTLRAVPSQTVCLL